MSDKLRPGISAETSFAVERRFLASEVGSGLVSVFSTAMMIAGMEAAAVKALQPYLPEGVTTVGVHVDVSHKAATPFGMNVRFRATLEEIEADGRKFRLRVEAWDEAGLIGEGWHERATVHKEKFEARTLARGKTA